MFDENSLIFLVSSVISVGVILKRRFSIVRPDAYVSFMILIGFVLPQLYIEEKVNWKSSIVFLVGYISFLLPFMFSSSKQLTYRKVFLFDFKVSNKLLLLKKIYLPLVLIILYFSTSYRITYSIGIPAVESDMKYSGIIYYLLTSGIFVLISTFFIFVYKYNKGKITFMIMLFSYAIYQSILGWRQGVFDVILLIIVLSNTMKSKISFAFKFNTVCILISIVTVVVQLQNKFRGDSDKSILDIWERLFGIRYLNSVVDYFVNSKKNSILFNDFFYFELDRLNINTADYHNHIILGGHEGFINGAARTGFGSMFMLFGLVGVSIVFYFLGRYYKKLYAYYEACSMNLFFTIFYGLNIIILQRILIEQIDFGVIIHFLVFTFFTILIFKIFKFFGLKINKIHAYDS